MLGYVYADEDGTLKCGFNKPEKIKSIKCDLAYDGKRIREDYRFPYANIKTKQFRDGGLNGRYLSASDFELMYPRTYELYKELIKTPKPSKKKDKKED